MQRGGGAELESGTVPPPRPREGAGEGAPVCMGVVVASVTCCMGGSSNDPANTVVDVDTLVH
jgi:hypothetical protein